MGRGALPFPSRPCARAAQPIEAGRGGLWAHPPPGVRGRTFQARHLPAKNGNYRPPPPFTRKGPAPKFSNPKGALPGIGLNEVRLISEISQPEKRVSGCWVKRRPATSCNARKFPRTKRAARLQHAKAMWRGPPHCHTPNSRAHAGITPIPTDPDRSAPSSSSRRGEPATLWIACWCRLMASTYGVRLRQQFSEKEFRL